MISGSFTGAEASDLAKLINYGALPVTLKQVNVENVSPTLGNDQLHAGIIAGIIGLALVAIYMLALLPTARPRGHRRDPAQRHGALLVDRLDPA